jgi:excisionase family DNA binding protein
MSDLWKKPRLSIAEAARLTGYSRDVISGWLQRGELGFETVPTGARRHCRRIRTDELLGFLDRFYCPPRSAGQAARLDFDPRSGVSRRVMQLQPKAGYPVKHQEFPAGLRL